MEEMEEITMEAFLKSLPTEADIRRFALYLQGRTFFQKGFSSYDMKFVSSCLGFRVWSEKQRVAVEKALFRYRSHLSKFFGNF